MFEGKIILMKNGISVSVIHTLASIFPTWPLLICVVWYSSKLLIKVPDKKNIGCREFVWVSHVNIAFFLIGCSQKLSLTVSFNRNAPKIRAHPSVRKGGCYEVHDIEDLVKVGEMVQGMVFYLHKLEFQFTQVCLLFSGITFCVNY